jgi:membrane protein implicated in regulation of membrane protease activity
MPTTSTTNSSIEVVHGVSEALVGGGVVTMALFPLALPIIILTVVATLPLLLVALAAGLVVALLAAPVLLVRRRRRSTRAPRRSPVPDRRLGRLATLRGS